MKIPHPRLNFMERIYVAEVFRGMGVTLRHLAKNVFAQSDMPTVQFPEETKPLPVRHRSRHRLTVRDNGDPKCVACMCCATACPAYCIHIVAEESDKDWIEKRPKIFEIDLLRCVFCGFCVEACPEDAIRMDTGEVLIVGERRQDFVVDREFLMHGKKDEWKINQPEAAVEPAPGHPEAPPDTPDEIEPPVYSKPGKKIPAGWKTNSKGV